MTIEQTISWIFLATAMATQKGPTDFQGISSIADGINHAVPTHKEMQSSISWLIQKGVVQRSGNKYLLTQLGRDEYESISSGSTNLFDVWKKLELKINGLT